MKKFKFVLLSSILFSSILSIVAYQQDAQALECVAGTVARDSKGNIARCMLKASNKFAQRFLPNNPRPDVEFACQEGSLIGFHETGAVSFCTLERPIYLREGNARVECPRGRVISCDEKGLLRFPSWCS